MKACRESYQLLLFEGDELKRELGEISSTETLIMGEGEQEAHVATGSSSRAEENTPELQTTKQRPDEGDAKSSDTQIPHASHLS